MRASRKNWVAAGALVAGIAMLAPAGAFAGPRVLHTISFVGHGRAFPGADMHGRFDRVAGFDRRRGWRGARYGLDALGEGTIAVVAPQFDSSEASWSQVVISTAPAAAPAFAPGDYMGPEIIEIGARTRRHIRFPLVVYGDS